MTQLTLKIHRKGDPPLDFVPPSGVIVHVQDRLTVALLEGGMTSGEPSIAIMGVSPVGHGVIVETSLDKFLMAAVGLIGLAEAQLGWAMPSGYASLLPGGDVSEGRFHRHPDDPARLGPECLSKVCDQDHLTALWRNP